MKRRIGTLYLSGKYFLDEANQTIGAPLVGSEMERIIRNRRNVTNRVNAFGKQAKNIIKDYFAKKEIPVRLEWSVHAGCTMCSCSPGFKIIAVNGYRGPQYDIWIDDDDEIQIQYAGKKRYTSKINWN